MKKLLFETNLKGHRMEYIHHLYLGMMEHQEHNYVIVVPQEFEQRKEMYEWPVVNNIRVVFLPKKSESKDVDDSSLLRESWRKTKLLRYYVKKEKADGVFLISLMEFIPFLPILIPKRVRVSGIIYKIYLYRWKNSSWKSRMGDVFKYLVLSGRNCINAALILNDAPAARRYNSLYHTDKFHFITDPYNAIDYSPKNVRAELGVSDDDKVFLHFGGLNRRKGTLEILKSLSLMDEKQKNLAVFIFAGKIYQPIYDEFYHLLNEVKDSTNIIVLDKFVDNEQLADLIFSSDFILAPYSGTIQSSGVLGHAAYWGKPVIGPSQGLVGKLIKRHNLGVTLPEITPNALADVMSGLEKYELKSHYNDEIKINNFLKAVVESC